MPKKDSWEPGGRAGGRISTALGWGQQLSFPSRRAVLRTVQEFRTVILVSKWPTQSKLD